MVPIILLPPNILHILEDIFKSDLRPNLIYIYPYITEMSTLTIKNK